MLLKRRPQDLDYDQTAAIFYVVVTIGINYISTALSGAFSQPLLISAVQNLAIVGILFAMLNISGKSQRLVQTLTAFFGVSAIISITTLLLVQLPVIGLLAVVLMGWNFYLMVLILRDAFDASMFRAVILVIAINMIAVFLTSFVVPGYVEEFQSLIQASQST